MDREYKDVQSVTPEGRRIEKLIAGVIVRSAISHEDERGSLSEIYDPAWGVTDAPLVYVYQTTIRPGRVKGWVYHKEQTDRLFVSLGFLKIVLFDKRNESPTKGMINEIHVSERNRALVVIPENVVHAVQNIGNTEGLFINMPTRPYLHSDPDKYRIPLDSGLVPYSFERGLGW